MRIRITVIFGDVPTASEFETLLAFAAILASFQPNKINVASQTLALIIAIFEGCVLRPI
jgi:hypothetical protein